MTRRSISIGLFVAGAVLVGLWLRAAPPLPPELAAMKCPAGLDRVVEVAGTRLLAPCRTWAGEAGTWSTWLRRTPHGVLEISPPDVSPRIQDAQWSMIANAFADTSAFKSWLSFNDKKSNGYYRQIEVPTPPAFAATGAQTPFWCAASFDGNSRHQCYGEMLSGRTQWGVLIHFGEPLPRNFDMRPGLSEAYAVLAAHVIEK